MKRTISWLAVILFLGCLTLGYLVVQEKTEVTQVTLHEAAADKDAQSRIFDLQHQLAAAKAAQAPADKPTARSTPDSSAPSPAQSGSTNGGPKIIHISDIMKDHPEYAALYAQAHKESVEALEY